MADVFISYSRADRARVEPIAEALNAAGLTTWFDARLEAGDSYDAAITRELRAAKSALVCWSKASVESEWVRAEATEAKKRGVLVACLLEPCEPFPPFNLTHYEDLSGWKGDRNDPRWARLQETIARRVRGERDPPNAPAPASNPRKKPPLLALGAAALVLAGAVVLAALVNRPSAPKDAASVSRDAQAATGAEVAALEQTFEAQNAKAKQLREAMEGNGLASRAGADAYRALGDARDAAQAEVVRLRANFAAAPETADPTLARQKVDALTAAIDAAQNVAAASAPARGAARDFVPGAETTIDFSLVFDADSAAISSDGSRTMDGALQRLSDQVSSIEDVRQIVVTAIAEPADGALAQRRAALVRDALIARGVPGDRIRTETPISEDDLAAGAPKVAVSMRYVRRR